jgi:hypothetical protein
MYISMRLNSLGSKNSIVGELPRRVVGAERLVMENRRGKGASRSSLEPANAHTPSFVWFFADAGFSSWPSRDG